MSSEIARALLADLDDDTLDVLAARLAPKLALAPAPSPWLNATEAAEYLRCKPQRIYDLVSAGHLHPARDGSRLLFARTHLDQYLSNATKEAA